MLLVLLVLLVPVVPVVPAGVSQSNFEIILIQAFNLQQL